MNYFFNILNTFNFLFFFQLFLWPIVCFLYIFLFDFYLNENGEKKLEKDQVEVLKRNAFYIFSLFSLLIIVIELYIYIQKIHLKLNLPEIMMMSFTIICLGGIAAFWGSRFIAGKHIVEQPQKTIEKEKTAVNFGNLFDVVKPTEQVGRPLITYTERGALRITNEDRGIVIGASGTGKTTYLITQIIDWMTSGQSFVVTDIKPEIWAILKYNNMFERYGYKDWVFNPTDVNSDHYNIFSEVKDSSEFNEVLNIIITDTDSSDAKVFNDNARRLLKAILIELDAKASLPNAQSFINSMDNNAELLKTLRQSDNKIVSRIAKEITSTAKSDNLLASIMTAVSQAFDFLDDERISKTISENTAGFYLKDVLMKPKQAVFLQFDQQYKSSTATLFGAMVAHTMRILQANQKRGAVFLALDEIINCAPIPKFTDFLNTIRSANMPTCIYLQSLEGLNRLYGANVDRLFLGASNYKITFRIDDDETAKRISSIIGQTKTTYYGYSKNSNQSMNNSENGISHTTNTGSSNSQNTKNEAILDYDEILRLENHHAVVVYNGKFGILEIPKYWELFDTPIKITKASPSDWLEHQKMK